jgi:hypothetical protein
LGFFFFVVTLITCFALSNASSNFTDNPCTGSSAPPAITVDQCALWQDFFDTMDGPEWNDCNSSRSDPLSCVLSHGQGIHGGTWSVGAIEDIILFDLGLKGTLPKSIGKMTGLVNLELGYNHLTGTIPSDLEQLKQLQSLDLTNNQLTGTIPPALANLKNLTTLWLRANKLTGLVPPLPFAQYNADSQGCAIDAPGDLCRECGQCNHFICPLPANSNDCKSLSDAGVRCGK